MAGKTTGTLTLNEEQSLTENKKECRLAFHHRLKNFLKNH